MEFQHHSIDGWFIVYGFTEGFKAYSLMTNVDNRGYDAYVHGLLSKRGMKLDDVQKLCQYIGKLTEPKYVIFQVLPHHAKVWKACLNVYAERKGKTFNGLDCVALTVKAKYE